MKKQSTRTAGRSRRKSVESLGIERRRRGKRLSPRCPECGCYASALSEAKNLARCFRCARSYNPIDLVMAVRGAGFLDAVAWLRALAGSRSEPGAEAASLASLNRHSRTIHRRRARSGGRLANTAGTEAPVRSSDGRDRAREGWSK